MPIQLLLLLLLSPWQQQPGCLAADQAAFTATMTGNASYLELPAWRPCVNASLSLEFRSSKATGLLLYSELGPGLFLNLNLLEGRLQLSLNLESNASQAMGPLIAEAGQDLHLPLGGGGGNGGGFQRVSVTVSIGRVAFRLGNRTQTLPLHNPAAQAASATAAPGGPVFVGGLPANLTRDGSSRAFIGVVFQARFAGTVRNVLYTDCASGRLKAPGILRRHNCHLRRLPPTCAEATGCLNGGLCLVGDDNKPFCFCPDAYIGPRCERQKDEVPTTFNGRGHIQLDINALQHVWGFHGASDMLRLNYRTRQTAAFLAYAGSEDAGQRDFIALSLRDGQLRLSMSVSGSISSVDIPPQLGNRLQFADSQWHRLQVERSWQKSQDKQHLQITVSFDDHVIQNFTVSRGGSLSIKTIYLGGYGSLPAGLAKEAAEEFFVGCMREARLQSGSADLDMLRVARDSQHGFRAVGMPSSAFGACADPPVLEPVRFSGEPGGHLALPRQTVAAAGLTSLAFSFATAEPDGLLAFIGSNGTDFLGFELRDGQLNFLLDAGAGVLHLRLSGTEAPLSTRSFNRVRFVNGREDSGERFVSVNDIRVRLPARRLSSFHKLDLGDILYLGGMPQVRRFTAPPELHSAGLGLGFNGLMANVSLNGDPVDIAFAAAQGLTASGVEAVGGAESVARRVQLCQAEPAPCRNGGACRVSWDRVKCDCFDTLFTGPTCETKAPVLKFDGTGLARVAFTTPLRTLAEGVTVGFRTNASSGLIFATANTKSETGDFMQLMLDGGRLFCRVNYGNGTVTLEAGNSNLGDNRWHSVRIRRREADLELVLDGKPKFAKRVLTNPKDYKLLETSDINLGRLGGAEPRPAPDLGAVSSAPYFVGSLTQFSFNNVRYFERDAKLDAATTLEVSARVDDSPVDVVLPFTVRSSAAFAELPPLRLYELFRIRLSLRTSQSAGLLLLNAGRGGQVADFFMLELLESRIRLAINAGSGLAELMLGESLNDNRWHEVEVRRPALDRVVLRVDGRRTETAMPSSFDGASEASRRAGLNVDVGDNPAYLGGAPQEELLAMKSGVGFQGCLGSVHLYEDINSPYQQPYDVISLRRNRTSFESDITDSCQKPLVQCGPRTCHYGGQCVQQWDRVACNCDATSFTGAWCSRVGSATFQFGASGRVGRISFQFVDDSFLPTTKRDEVSFGFQTGKSSCVLVLIEAKRVSGAIPDFIAIQVVKGRLVVKYYLKSSITSLVKPRLNVSDGRYHRVRFLREEARGSLFVDDSRPVVATPGADFGTTFNSQKAIYVGSMAPVAQHDVAAKAATIVSGAGGRSRGGRRGRRSAAASNEWSHFEGHLTGLVFNGVALSRIAADDPVASSVVKMRTERFGDVSRVENFQPRLDGFPPPDPPDSYLHPELMMSTSPGETTPTAIIETKIRCAQVDSAVKSAVDCIGSGGIITPGLRTLGAGKGSHQFTDAPPDPGRDRRPGWQIPTRAPPDSDETRETKAAGGQQSSAKIDIFIIVIVAASGAVLLFVFFCLIYRCRSKNEGSYRVDETQNFEDPALKPLRGAAHANGDVRTKMATKKRDIKE